MWYLCNMCHAVVCIHVVCMYMQLHVDVCVPVEAHSVSKLCCSTHMNFHIHVHVTVRSTTQSTKHMSPALNIQKACAPR